MHHNEALLASANLQASQGQLDKAINTYHQALKKAPENPVLYYNLGRAYVLTKNYTRAIESFQKSAYLAPNHYPSLNNLALCYLEIQSPHQALDYLNVALTLKPNLRLHLKAAEIATNINEHIMAENHLLAALALEPLNETALLCYGHYLTEKKLIRQAIAQYKTLLNHFPHNITAWFNIAVLYNQQNNQAKALQAYEQVVRLNPYHADAHYNMVLLYKKTHNLTKAKTHLSKAYAIKPDDERIGFMKSSLIDNISPKSMPINFVRSLFDDYAAEYNKSLASLNYQLPALLSSYLQKYIDIPLHLGIEIGCGTGLCAKAIKTRVQRLIGIDIARSMLEKAKALNEYAMLIQSDALTGLLSISEKPSMIIAADVLPYLGDLKRLFETVKKLLPKHGYFCFTTENSNESPFLLQNTSRYAHAHEYLHLLCKQFHFSINKQEKIVLRLNQNQPIYGSIFLLQA